MSAERLERNARTVTVLTFVSRVTGLARDAALSRCFGIGPVMDAVAFAFILPNLFRRLFGEGALAAAFLPVYARLERSDQDSARHLAALVVALLMALLGAITVVGEMVLGGLSVATGHENLTVRLMMITLPYMPLVCLVAVLGAMLQVHGRFGPTATSPIILNGFIVVAAIGSGWLLGDGDSTLAERAVVVSAAVSLAGVVQVFWALWSLRERGVPWLRPTWAARPALREVLAKAGPMILGLGVLQLNTFVDGLIASWPSAVGPTIAGFDYPLDQGALATLGYAQRLYEFPLGVFGISVATAIFPLLAKQAHDRPAFMETLRRGLRLVLFIGLPASVGLMLTSAPLTAVVLQGGDFGADDTRRVALVLIGYAPAVWAYSMNHTLTRAIFALGDTSTPVRISVAMVGLNVVLNVLLICTPLKEAGLAWSTAVCAVIQSVLLMRALRRRTGGAGDASEPIVDAAVRRSWWRTAKATVAMAAAVGAVVLLTSTPGASWSRQLAILAGCVGLGSGVFAALAVAMRMPELTWAMGRRGATK
jgi:putative peptidoglycan lipid II flippase